MNQHSNKKQRLILGCMGLGGGWNDNPITDADIQQAHRVIDAALEAGITRFDHADIYTFGKAETVFGQVLKQRPELKAQLQLQSKCGIRFADDFGPKRYDLSKDWICQSVDGILQRLNIERLDTLMLHRPDPLMEPDEIASAFEQLRQSGKVVNFGVSNMMAPQLALLQSALSQPLMCNQLEISLSRLDWLEQNVVANTGSHPVSNLVPGTLEYCTQHNVEIQAWGSLSQGRFTGRTLDSESQSTKETAALIQVLADQYQCAPEALVLAFLLRHSYNLSPVLGSSTPERIQACATSVDVNLSREDWYRLYERARGGELP